MICPKCQQAQADGLVECSQCGVIFAKLALAGSLPTGSATRTRRLAAEDTDDGTDAAASEAKSPASLLVIFLLIAAIAAAGWWLNNAKGKPLLAGAHQNDKGFSLVVPNDWLALTAKNFDALLKPYQNRFPAELRKLLSSSKFEIAFVKIPEKEGEFSPSINVIALPLKGTLPPLTENERSEATKIIADEMGKLLENYKMEGSRITPVDKINALEVKSTASIRIVLQPSVAIESEPGAFGMKHVVGHSKEVARTFDLKSVQTFVPAREWAFIISCNFEAADFGDAESTCKDILETFRVANRPPRFGGITMGALNGGLIGAGIFLLWMFGGRAARQQSA